MSFHNQSTGLTILQYQSLETLDLLIIRWTFFISVIVCVLLFLFVFVCKCMLRRIYFFGRGSGTRPVLLGSQGYTIFYTVHVFKSPKQLLWSSCWWALLPCMYLFVFACVCVCLNVCIFTWLFWFDCVSLTNLWIVWLC